MSAFSTFLVRLVLLACGLLFAASLAVVFVLLVALWGVRAAWARLTGKPVAPFIVGMDTLHGLRRMYRRADAHARKPHAASSPTSRWGRGRDDVTDVEPRGG